MPDPNGADPPLSKTAASDRLESGSHHDQETDDFGLPIRPITPSRALETIDDDSDDEVAFHDATDIASPPSQHIGIDQRGGLTAKGGDEKTHIIGARTNDSGASAEVIKSTPIAPEPTETPPSSTHVHTGNLNGSTEPNKEALSAPDTQEGKGDKGPAEIAGNHAPEAEPKSPDVARFPSIRKAKRSSGNVVSEWSHQRLVSRDDKADEEEEVEWQAMPALGEFDIYNDVGRIVAKGTHEDEVAAYTGVGTAGKGYTRVQLDEDAQSATSLDEDTNYLFKAEQKKQPLQEEEIEEDEEQRDAATQLQNTKGLLTEGQRIAYVGVVRLTIFRMLTAIQDLEVNKQTKKEIAKATESMEIWGQQIMVRLYSHMEIETAEQIMIEQLAEHGVQPSDLVPPLMLNARIKNPLKDDEMISKDTDESSDLPPYSEEPTGPLKDVKNGEEVPEVQDTDELVTKENLEIDLRWTVLCDLFLLLIADSSYDARSRRLLERVASAMQISWVQICRFEKRVIDALEGQETEMQENHDESENMEKRRKVAMRKKYMYMGLATVGGGLVIGLSAGLAAPLIGAGLAAGFTTIGVGGTAGFLTGIGGAALVTSIGITTGGTVALRASDRRTGHVKTFEYRPLHNNKRLNLILAVSGWMSGKVDDVRLPYSTVDPLMGDIYSLLWEPDMLRSMGETINILATEALTQTVQQVLGATFLMTLMAGLQIPLVLTKLSYLIDNPWSVSLDRANAAGLILADSLMQRHLGGRPITLVGFSLGARLIFACLKELSNRGAYGIVQNVYLFGCPIVAKKDDCIRVRSVISGRFVNGYAANDWILGYLFRATSGGLGRVAGLAAIEDVPGLENVDVGKMVNGHMTYRTVMPKLLREVGWEVESDEFTEIEDPDPENHEKRQRELIQEIDKARKQAEEKPEKKRFAFFRRGKGADKAEWEKYDATKSGHKRSTSNTATNAEGDVNVLFDIDAIRRELASEMIEVRELDSNQPPMQITSVKDGEKHVEYLRLPPEVDLKGDEMARMKLPPRPDEMDVNFGPVMSPPPRKSSLLPSRPSPASTRHASPQRSPLPSPRRSPSPQHSESYTFEEPRELISTLPPLQLSPSFPQQTTESDSIFRPALKTHVTEPPPPADRARPQTSIDEISSPVEAISLEHNAWADDFGHGKEVKMTFE